MDAAFRVFYNKRPATKEELDQIEEITVDQAGEMAWEARLRIPAALDERGGWSGREDYMKPYARVRVEVRLEGGEFSALIDGAVAGYENAMHSEPGRSWITLVVHDDSAALDRVETMERFEQKRDDEVARELFRQADEIDDPADIDETPQAPNALSPVFMQRGSAMQMLRTLAKRNGMYVSIRPGKKAGDKSTAEFKRPPSKPSDLPELVLTGNGRNVRSFQVLHNGRRAAKFQSASLNFSDKTVTSSVSDLAGLDGMGDSKTYADEAQVATRWFHSSFGGGVDPDHAVQAAAAQAAYALRAKGSVLAGVYNGVLQPNRGVTVRGVGPALAGAYLITRVTHRLTSLEYLQEFEVTRNALTPESSGSASSVAGSGRTDINTWGGLC